jgi:hypothetical protein
MLFQNIKMFRKCFLNPIKKPMLALYDAKCIKYVMLRKSKVEFWEQLIDYIYITKAHKKESTTWGKGKQMVQKWFRKTLRLEGFACNGKLNTVCQTISNLPCYKIIFHVI